MSDTYYICKYTPVELLAAFGGTCQNLTEAPDGFELAEALAHPNLCGFGKALLEAVLRGDIRELVLTDCCDTVRSVCDVLLDEGKLDFLYMADILHGSGSCAREYVAEQLKKLAEAYGEYKGTAFDEKKFREAFKSNEKMKQPHIAVMGARMGDDLLRMAESVMPLPIENMTCVSCRSLGAAMPPEGLDFDGLMDWYAGELLAQIPCMRMADNGRRRELWEDEGIVGVIYHTIKFCDFYSFEYADLRNRLKVPLLKIESDYTTGSSGQLRTRLEAFAEEIEGTEKFKDDLKNSNNTIDCKKYFAGIDSGSASTDVVILDGDKNVVASVALPTGAGAAHGAQRALDEALDQAGLTRSDISATVTTGYGRENVDGDGSVTEISCHAKGAHFLNPDIRTVIDIGGQDSKVIRLGEDGSVVNFAMNDKCAAGTGRFLEMMARTMEMTLDEMANCGLKYNEDITISSMCTVFAESEVVSLIAQNKDRDDIVRGLDKAVAAKTVALVRRAGGEGPYMMTGGVSKNRGLVLSLSERLGAKVEVSDMSQLCGALGAALYAMETTLSNT